MHWRTYIRRVEIEEAIGYTYKHISQHDRRYKIVLLLWFLRTRRSRVTCEAMKIQKVETHRCRNQTCSITRTDHSLSSSSLLFLLLVESDTISCILLPCLDDSLLSLQLHPFSSLFFAYASKNSLFSFSSSFHTSIYSIQSTLIITTHSNISHYTDHLAKWNWYWYGTTNYLISIYVVLELNII